MTRWLQRFRKADRASRFASASTQAWRRLAASGMVAALAIACLASFALPGCQHFPFPGRADQKPFDYKGEPDIRVRLERNAGRVDISGGGQLVVKAIYADFVSSKSLVYRDPITITRSGGYYYIRSRDSQPMRWRCAALAIDSDRWMNVEDKLLPHRIVLNANDGDRFDVINHVPVETYVTGVIAKELYSSWHQETFRAQAIAARTYALVQAHRRRHNSYDVESTTADQVYSGATTNSKAIDAARATRGQLLTYRGQPFTAYYSACVGGVGQDAAAVFQSEADIPPLRGRDHGAWGSNCKQYRWGPITRDARALSRRIAAWGRSHKHRVANLGQIRSIIASGRNPAGRPTEYLITDDRGYRFTIDAESLRVACNTSVAGLPTIDRDNRLLSSHFSAVASTDTITFRGQGFGHGVGMGQWGAQHMATQGHTHRAILAHYYPGSEIKTFY